MPSKRDGRTSWCVPRAGWRRTRPGRGTWNYILRQHPGNPGARIGRQYTYASILSSAILLCLALRLRTLPRRLSPFPSLASVASRRALLLALFRVPPPVSHAGLRHVSGWCNAAMYLHQSTHKRCGFSRGIIIRCFFPKALLSGFTTPVRDVWGLAGRDSGPVVQGLVIIKNLSPPKQGYYVLTKFSPALSYIVLYIPNIHCAKFRCPNRSGSRDLPVLKL